jgi:hypothetical protein
LGSAYQKEGTFSGQKDVLAIISQFGYRLLYVVQGKVVLLLFEDRQGRIPSLHQLLNGTDIDVSIMEEGIETGHMFGQEMPVLPNRVAAKGRGTLLTVKSQE